MGESRTELFGETLKAIHMGHNFEKRALHYIRASFCIGTKLNYESFSVGATHAPKSSVPQALIDAWELLVLDAHVESTVTNTSLSNSVAKGECLFVGR